MQLNIYLDEIGSVSILVMLFGGRLAWWSHLNRCWSRRNPRWNSVTGILYEVVLPGHHDRGILKRIFILHVCMRSVGATAWKNVRLKTYAPIRDKRRTLPKDEGHVIAGVVDPESTSGPENSKISCFQPYRWDRSCCRNIKTKKKKLSILFRMVVTYYVCFVHTPIIIPNII